ncbi:mechanosensitive ion channel [Kitasatospora paracochleata]|uniref:Small-conductance mechanosensitive channel n=1 Tax=Kitasatospora paracochleata TaxID=58354 RepID=A0ABT1J2X9_9ACTN|nr:mechanosensitive ion channel domain-containing protein [Kitasatospora paracochleata]MCP2311796.1 small-conductance mechanosensitive channel [Kitasatospora paracochleata]
MWWSAVRLFVVTVVAVLAAYGLSRASEAVARRLAARGRTGGVPRLLRNCRRPLLATIGCAFLLGALPWVGATPAAEDTLRHLLVLAAIGACAWLAARAVGLLVDGAVHLAGRRRDPAQAGRARTQAGLLGRICQAAIALIALGAMLMTFPAVRGIGTSLLASAGLVGVVAGVAAQSTLANIFAGVQMAFGDLVRIGDVVVVAGEWGTVEEITLTSVVIATWDQRRLVMPMSYFASRPFENWSRRTSRITGTALIHLDHSTPVADLRAEFDTFLAENPLWDGEGSALQIVDTTPSTIVVRALATAANADDAFELRCQLREHLVGYIGEKHPHALPRVSVTRPPRPREAADAERRRAPSPAPPAAPPSPAFPPSSPNLHGRWPHRSSGSG